MHDGILPKPSQNKGVFTYNINISLGCVGPALISLISIVAFSGAYSKLITA